jgi:hypothetical protein
MKLSKLIQALEKAQAEYVKKHGTLPEIFDLSVDGYAEDKILELELCKQVRHTKCQTEGLKPYVKRIIKII